MKKTIYIFTNGRLRRKDNSLYFESEDGMKKYIPIENVNEIFVFGEFDINSKAVNFLSQKEIILSYFNYYGYYMGTFYPRKHYNSGYMILRQSEYYLDNKKRIMIAKKFIKGAVENQLKNLKYYNRRDKDLEKIINEIEILKTQIEKQENINNLMAIEGQIKQIYFQGFNEIISNDEFRFTERTRRPPQDYLNALISFSNVIIYNYVLNEIYKTHLDPRIGFLHSTNFRRFTLNLDVAEIFKPVIGDRTIFSLINKGIISSKNFDKQLNGIILNEKGKKKFLENIEEKLKQTIKHSTLKRNVSYRRLIRLELYKLEKHLMGEKEYKPFVMEW